MSDTLGLACEHGMLARACEVCEMQSEITTLRAALDQEREKVERVEKVRDYWCNEAQSALSHAADITLEIEHMRPEVKALEAKAAAWERDALRYAQNADFWRAALDQERAKSAEAAHLLTKTRIWGGMGWHWNPYVEKAHALLSGRGESA